MLEKTDWISVWRDDAVQPKNFAATVSSIMNKAVSEASTTLTTALYLTHISVKQYY